jgi:hypothetical protein
MILSAETRNGNSTRRTTMKKRLLTILAPLIFLLAVPILALAEEWTPMVSSAMFDGIKADLFTMIGGIVTIFFIILGLVMLMRAGGR